MATLCITASASIISGIRVSSGVTSTSSSPNTVRYGLSPLYMNPLRCFYIKTRSRSWRKSHVVCMAPDEEKMTRRSPLDFPIEWERPKPGRRPDIFPQFSPMKTPLPPPMPADPPEEDEEEEEKKEEEEDDPEKEEQENPEK